jgi:transitional endoplasmic reticulum ATPase
MVQIKLNLFLPSPQEALLRVDNVKQEDFGRAIARIDNRIMQKLGISAGDPIEIIGKRTTSAIAWPAYSEHQNRDIIRIDGFTRKNAEVAINEYLIVRPAKVKEALSITLEPIRMRLTVDKDFTNFIKNNLLERTFIKGDTTFVTLLGHDIAFIVTKTRPQGIVKITTNTKITVLKGKAKGTGEEITDS